MSFDADEEILQDFLVEAGEILELLSEQLVDLENSPDDVELLNAIFRGFHTVKGGAGFLQLDTLVDVCHIAENTFDHLRNGKLAVTSEVMDVVLQALDSVNSMFAQVNQRIEPDAAEPELLAALTALVEGGAAESKPEVEESPQATESSSQEDEISEEEFERMLDAKSDGDKGAGEKSTKSSGSPDEITDGEFENLLDELHGKGGPTSGSKSSDADTTAKAAKSNSDAISDDEFENLLDELHGKGKHGASADAGAPAAKAAPVKNVPKPAAAKPAAAAAGAKPVAKPIAKPPAKGGGKEQPALTAETTVRVDTKRLDDIMNMVGELVLVRNRLVRLGLKSSDESMAKAVANLDVVTADLQTSVMKTRMQPIKKVFGRFPRVVRDLARNLKKEINLVLKGEDTDLDKNLVEALADPLVHLVRNSVDHGIEMPDVRAAAGKDRVGSIILAAQQEGDHIVLSITDDGAGMDPNMLRGKAVEKGLMDQESADRLTDTDCFNLIFHPGFSTKVEISDVSGRGVGMDVVKTKITQLNGMIEIHSETGKGSTIKIKVPLTLAIMPTLMVMLGQQTFALPLVSVNEIFHMDLSTTNVVDGQEVVIVREKALPLFHLKKWLVNGVPVEKSDNAGHVVIVTVGTQKVGFVVDQLIGQEEVVIKPLGKMLHGTDGMAGATITGDGTIALILDVPTMLNRYATRL